MIREELIFVATCDISGHVRGKGFPACELPGAARKRHRLDRQQYDDVAGGPIWDTPFGTAGDQMIVPDPAAEVRVDFGDGSAVEHFFLGDIRTTDGEPWECCPRDFLRRAARELEEISGLHAIAAFEQEFLYTGIEDRPGDAYALGAFRRQGGFGEAFIAALRAAGPVPDSFLAEYGPRQFEVTVAPQPALTAADHAVAHPRNGAGHGPSARASRDLSRRSPIPIPGGNGVHIHRACGTGLAGLPPGHPGDTMDLSQPAQHFCAGVLHHMPAICAVCAPSPVSYLRLVPNAFALTSDRSGRARTAAPACEFARSSLPPTRRTPRASSTWNSVSATRRRALIWHWARSSSPAPTASAGLLPSAVGRGETGLVAANSRQGARQSRRQRHRRRLVRPHCTATPICASSGSKPKRSPRLSPGRALRPLRRDLLR